MMETASRNTRTSNAEDVVKDDVAPRDNDSAATTAPVDSSIPDLIDRDSHDWKRREIKIAIFENFNSPKGRIREWTHEAFMQRLCEHDVGEKAGFGYLQGALVSDGASKKIESVRDMEGIGYDFDDLGSPEALARLEARIQQLGLAAVIYTTHRHTAALPRVRVWLPFSHRAPLKGADVADQKRWSRAYVCGAHVLQAAHDPKCENINRFLYFPRHADGAGFYTRVVDGAPLSWDKLDALAGAHTETLSARQSSGRRASEASLDFVDEPEHFAAFWPEFREHCDIAQALATCDDLEPEEKTEGKTESACVFPDEDHIHDDGTQNPDPTKRPLVAYDASAAQYGTATVSCVRSSCPGARCNIGPRGYAALILARFDVHEWREFVEPEHQRRFDAWLELQPETLDGIGESIEALEAGDARKAGWVIAELGKHDVKSWDVQRHIDRLNEKIGGKRKAIADAVGAEAKIFKTKKEHYRRKYGGRDGSNTRQTSRAVPVDPGDADVIWRHWDHHDKVCCAEARLLRVNAASPTVFTRPEGGAVRLTKVSQGLTLCEMARDEWVYEFTNKGIAFREVDEGEERGVPPFPDVVAFMMGSPKANLPVIEKIETLPVFDKEGRLRTERGYVPEMRVYLEPNFEALPVPDSPSEDDVQEALWWLHEITIDMHMSDQFTGDETLPIHVPGARDKDGWPLQNRERGKSSRANWLASLLQGVTRNMIDGCCNAYLFDKAVPGAGASLLIKLHGTIMHGEPSGTLTYKANEEENEKLILAAMRGGAPKLAWDNVAGGSTVDSAVIAKLITDAVFSGRVLGATTLINVPVTQTFMFAGNNLGFTEEMMRRIAPIRIDADHPRPETRPDTAFKHSDLFAWVKENRAKLVWSLHVLVRNWVAKGCPNPPGDVPSGSFGNYVRVMKGILHAADPQLGAAFLANHADYYATRNEERGDREKILQDLFDDQGARAFSSSEVTNVFFEAGFNSPKYPESVLPNKTEAGQAMAIGKWLRTKSGLGVPVALCDEKGVFGTRGADVRVKLVNRASGNNKRYAFVAAPERLRDT